MSDKIFNIISGKPVYGFTREAQEDIVRDLEDALGHARSGNLTSIVICAETADGAFTAWTAGGAKSLGMIGLLQRWVVRLAVAMDE